MTSPNITAQNAAAAEAAAALEAARVAKLAKAAADRKATRAAAKSSNDDPALAALKNAMNAGNLRISDKDLAKEEAKSAAAVKAGKAAVKSLKGAIKAAAKSPTLNKINNVTSLSTINKGIKAKGSAFGTIASSLNKDEAASAKAAATAAVKKASDASRAPSVKPADTARYVLGAYKGRAGAMYEFMKRAGGLPEGFTREAMVESCAKKAPHAAVATRAQVLDYFAWAVRHGLLHVTEAAPVAAKVKAAKAVKGRSRLLQNPAA